MVRAERVEWPERRRPRYLDGGLAAITDAASDRPPVFADDVNRGVVRERVQDFFKEPARMDRRAEIAHVAREHVIKLIEPVEAARRRHETTLLGLANLIADLSIESIPHGRAVRRKRKQHP